MTAHFTYPTETRWTPPASRPTSPACKAASSASSKPSMASLSAPIHGDARTGGGGISRLIEEGGFFERGGCQFLARHRQSPARLGHRSVRPNWPAARSRRWACRWYCTRAIPIVPTVHMNVRMLRRPRQEGDDAVVRGSAAAWTSRPTTAIEEDALHFHRTCRDALAPLWRPTVYPRFKAWCDEYFFLKHRNEPRGVGGVFFDDSQRGRFRAQLRADPRPSATPSSRPTCRSPSAAATRPMANASATSRPTGAAATSSSTWSGTAARCSACNRAAAPSRS